MSDKEFENKLFEDNAARVELKEATTYSEHLDNEVRKIFQEMDVWLESQREHLAALRQRWEEDQKAVQESLSALYRRLN